MDYVASAVMLKDVKTVPPSMTLAQLEAAFVQDRVTGYAVVENGHPVGVVTRSDLLRALAPNYDITDIAYTMDETGSPRGTIQLLSESLGDRADSVEVRDIMTSQIVAVQPNDHLHVVADLMHRKKIHRIFVVENDQLLGIITPFDFVRLYSNDRIGADARPSRTLDF